MVLRSIPWWVMLASVAGCTTGTLALPNEEPPAVKVSLSPFTEPGIATVQARINVAPASTDTAVRVELVGRGLIGQLKQLGRPNITALASNDPEIFHVGMNNIYITEALVKQCATDGQLAAVLANEFGRIIAEREAAVSAEVRQPDPQPPIEIPIGATGNTHQVKNEVPVPLLVFNFPTPASANREGDRTKTVEMAATYDKLYPRRPPKLAPPNPQMVARDLLENAGYQRTELDGAQALLENAARYSVLATQFRGTVRPANWSPP